VGDHEGTPYIAMELILGEELTSLCRRGLSLGRFLPLRHAVDLMRQAALGMGYFHSRRDDKAENLDIIHCDISPNNLLVTEDGSLKIIDFGIARARNQRYRDHGALPGKISYMSPEQVAKDPLDYRSDLFALGVVMYEITVGKRLFKGPADEVVRRVRECDVKPPTFVRKDYPGALESIVMRALEQHPMDRYESAYDMADDLDEFLRENRLRSGQVRIARYLDELTEVAGGTRRRELISESERRAEEDADELDFDRGMFDSFQAQVGGTDEAAAEWDEFDEDVEHVAAALGVDPAKLEKMGWK
jgi:serine/threonine-protein kinase